MVVLKNRIKNNGFGLHRIMLIRRQVLIRVLGLSFLVFIFGFLVFKCLEGLEIINECIVDDNVESENGDFRVVSEDDVMKASVFLHFGHKMKNCSNESEVSCERTVISYEFLKDYVNGLGKGIFKNYLRVVLLDNMSVACKMSMIYCGFLFAIAHKRHFVIHGEIGILNPELRKYFDVQVDSKPISMPCDHTLNCFVLKSSVALYELKECVFPQTPYLHPNVAPIIRQKFGYHAAFLVCNFLFEFLDVECPVQIGGIALAAAEDKDFLVKARNCNKTINKLFIEPSSQRTQICALKSLISTENPLYSFGLTLGWFASAMSLKKATIIELFGEYCINLKTSQSGSLYHLYNPKKTFKYSTNNHLYMCGTNYNDCLLFYQNLVW